MACAIKSLSLEVVMKKILVVLMLLCFISVGAFAQVTFASDSTISAGYDLGTDAFSLGATPNGSMTIKADDFTFVSTANLTLDLLDITAFGWNFSQKIDYKVGKLEVYATPKVATDFVFSVDSGVILTFIPYTTITIGYSNSDLAASKGGLSASAEFIF
jgi:hypothetical protein